MKKKQYKSEEIENIKELFDEFMKESEKFIEKEKEKEKEKQNE